MSCGFCYNVWSSPPEELTFREIEKLADSLDGVQGITFTGGEPLLRDDLPDLIRLFSARGIRTAIATNGLLLNRDRLAILVSAGIEHFDIGFTVPSEGSALAIAIAAGTGRSVTASLCIHGSNYLRTGTRVRTAAALGASSVCLNRFVPTGRGRENLQRFSISEEELHTALHLASEASQRCPVHLYTGIPVPTEWDLPLIDCHPCGCGRVKWAVDPSGNLRTCEQSSLILGSLMENTFSEILKQNSAVIDNFRKTTEKGCAFLC